LPVRNVSPDPAEARFFLCFQGLCGKGCALASAPGGPEAVSQGRCSLDLSTARVRFRSIKPLNLLWFDFARPEHFDVGRRSLNGPKSNFLTPTFSRPNWSPCGATSDRSHQS
jgi:hypothetical protein